MEDAYVICRPLHAHIAFIHDSLVTIVQNQLDGSFEDDSKVHTVCKMHEIDIVRRIAYSWEINDPTEHAGLVD